MRNPGPPSLGVYTPLAFRKEQRAGNMRAQKKKVEVEKHRSLWRDGNSRHQRFGFEVTMNAARTSLLYGSWEQAIKIHAL